MQRTLFAGVIGIIVSYYVIYTNHFDRPGIKALYVNLTIFLLLPVSALKTLVHN